jgi:hypothetical protein
VADLQALVGRYSYSRSPIMPGSALLLTVSTQESLKVVGNTITRTWDGSGDVAFVISPDHFTTVTSYSARLRVWGNATVIATELLGKPTPDGNGVIVVQLEGFFAGRSPGDYTVSILATSAGGSTDSVESNPFTIPLPRPIEKAYISESLTVVRA